MSKAFDETSKVMDVMGSANPRRVGSSMTCVKAWRHGTRARFTPCDPFIFATEAAARREGGDHDHCGGGGEGEPRHAEG